MTADEQELFLGWRWISKPRWRKEKERRTAFFKKTTPGRGKDMWVVENITDTSAVRWPHIWCEMVSEYWLDRDVALVGQKTLEGDVARMTEMDECLALAAHLFLH